MFSPALGREELCKQISLACVGSARSASAALGLPLLRVCVVSRSTLLRLQVALQGNCLKWALGYMHFSGSRLLCRELSEVSPGLYALPRSKPLRFRFSGTPQRRRLSWVCVLCPSQVQAAQVTRCLASAVSPGGECVLEPPWSQQLSFLGGSGCAVSGVPCGSSGELVSGCDPPGRCQLPRIPISLG